jgi:5-methylcytosine-specific restriction endonuclease McrA
LGLLHAEAQSAVEEDPRQQQAGAEAVIPVVLAQEPKRFDKRVRQRGLSAIDELVGRAPRIKHRGPRRAKIANVESKIPADKLPPFWRDALDDMMEAYEQRCAYLAMFIEATGNPTVDHVIPKSLAWDCVYEWSNYRLCTSIVNSKKGDLLGLVDPIAAKVGWFELDLASYRIGRGMSAPKTQYRKIDATLPLLNLRDCCAQRKRYVEDYRLGPGQKGIDLIYLEHRAPFVASELRRQGLLVRGDA